jgi:hypothetical protein
MRIQITESERKFLRDLLYKQVENFKEKMDVWSVRRNIKLQHKLKLYRTKSRHNCMNCGKPMILLAKLKKDGKHWGINWECSIKCVRELEKRGIYSDPKRVPKEFRK